MLLPRSKPARIYPLSPPFAYPYSAGDATGGGTLTLVSATIAADGETLTLVFSEVVDFGAGGNGGFNLDASTGGDDITCTYASGSGSKTLVYTLGTTVITGETCNLDYVQPGDGVEDADGSDLESFTDAVVTNNSTQEESGVVNVDAYISGEAGAAGDNLTTALLDSMTMTRADRAALGTWAITEDAAGDLQILADAPSAIVPVRTPNTTHSEGTRGMRFNLSAAGSVNNARYSFFSYRDRVAIGFFVKFPEIANGNSLDLVLLYGAASMVMQIDGTATGGEIKLHTGNPSQFYTPAYPVVAGTRYWVTMLFDRLNDECKLNVYSETGTLLDEQALGNLTANVDSGAYRLAMGRNDGISQPSVPDPAWLEINDLVVDMDDGTFPLGITSEEESSVVSGYLLADGLDAGTIPVGFSDYSGSAVWDGGASGELRVTSPAITRAIVNPQASIYVYAKFTPTTIAASKQFLFFYDEDGSTNRVSLGTAWNNKPQLYGGATGSMGGTLVQGTEYHVWMEWESGAAVRVYISTDGTKPTAPDANWTMEDASGIASANIGYIGMSGCSVCDWGDLRISNSALGDNGAIL